MGLSALGTQHSALLFTVLQSYRRYLRATSLRQRVHQLGAVVALVVLWNVIVRVDDDDDSMLFVVIGADGNRDWADVIGGVGRDRAKAANGLLLQAAVGDMQVLHQDCAAKSQV